MCAVFLFLFIPPPRKEVWGGGGGGGGGEVDIGNSVSVCPYVRLSGFFPDDIFKIAQLFVNL